MMSTRQRLLRISCYTLVRLLGSGVRHFEVIDHALPEDTRVVRVFSDDHLGCFMIVIESAVFDEVDEGAIIPEHPTPVVRDLRVDGPGDV